MGSIVRAMKGGYVDRGSLEKGPNGRNLCRWCSLEVPRGRFTFCSEWCVHEWRLRSDPGYLREQVFQRDRGVCAGCGLDAIKEWKRIRRLRGAKRAAAMQGWGLRTWSRKSLWDADHIVPVVAGGGECDLDNLRTLCLKCHKRATLELRKSLETQRKAAGLAPGHLRL